MTPTKSSTAPISEAQKILIHRIFVWTYLMGGEPITQFIIYESDNNQDQTMMVLTPEDIIGRTFLGQPRDDGKRHQATIINTISDHGKNLKSNPERIKYLYSFDNDQYEEIYAYNDIISHI